MLSDSIIELAIYFFFPETRSVFKITPITPFSNFRPFFITKSSFEHLSNFIDSTACLIASYENTFIIGLYLIKLKARFFFVMVAIVSPKFFRTVYFVTESSLHLFLAMRVDDRRTFSSSRRELRPKCCPFFRVIFFSRIITSPS